MDSLEHRGPDQRGYYVNKVSLGHQRLSIIDLSEKGRQPMFNEEGDICIVYNGEIYNFKQLREDLEKKGHKFNSQTDTEVILHAYEEHGFSCVSLFNGIFAFAIYDNGKLFLARDRLGIKPLYYYFKDGKFIFGSEIKAILQHDIARELNNYALTQYANYAFTLNGETMFNGIYELLPGNCLVFEKNNLKFMEYWNPDYSTVRGGRDFFSKKLKDLLFDSVKGQLVSDVPIGVALSGGLDSSVIAAMVSRFGNVKTFTVGFNDETDENKYARQVSEHIMSEHKDIYLDYGDVTEKLVKILWHMECPFGRPPVLPSFFLSNAISKEVKVSLIGEGSDELFGGYGRYYIYSKPKLMLNKRGIKSVIKSSYYSALPVSKKIKGIKTGYFNEGIFGLGDDSLAAYALKNNKLDLLNRALYFDVRKELNGVQLIRVDRASMASSHEMRVPYLDNNVVDFAMTIPSEFKISGYERKCILKSVAKDLLPKQIINREKTAFVVPFYSYFNNEFKNIASSLLANPKSSVDKDKANFLLNKIKNEKQKDDYYLKKILFLASLELWYRIFIESQDKKPSLSINNYL